MIRFFSLCALLLAAACAHREGAAPRAVALAIADVTVIDPEHERVLGNRSVFIDGDRIVAIVPAGRSAAFAAERVLDGAGRFLIPGLNDMHVHLFLPEPARPTLNLLLANGVTGIREMSGDCWELLGVKEGCVGDYKALQAALKAGALPGPEILSLTSTMVMGPSRLRVPDGVDPFVAPRTPDEARRLVRYLNGRGIDRIKTHDSIPRDAFHALMEEARTLGLDVAGHVPFGAGSLDAARRGYGSIEHARDLLYDCSRYGAELRRVMSDVTKQKGNARPPANVERLRRTVDGHDRALCTAFLADLARTGTAYVPTHVTREMEARAGEAGYRQDPARKYVLRARQAAWEKDLAETAALPEAERRALADFFRHGLEITGLAHRAGVRIMAGTDASDTMIVPGFSLHRELALLARAGLSPMEVLRTATTNPAAYMGTSGLHGGVSAGKEADLVLLSANPLDDIRNTARIEAVVSNGRLFDRPALDALLAEAERMASASAD